MSWLERNLTQSISYWAQTGDFDLYGSPTWSPPVLLDGRWEDKSELIMTPNGNEILSRSTVFLSVDIEIGDYLMLGEFNSSDTDPTQVSGAYKVKDFRKIPSVRGNLFERIAFL